MENTVNTPATSNDNIFGWDYVEHQLKNMDDTPSNFRQVFGIDGKNVACPKKSYNIILTEDISKLGVAFIDKGYDVSTFAHRNGEVIGLNINFGERPSKTGDCQYRLIITVPNNGGGKGYLSIKQTRLICTNGMVSNKTMHKDNYIKIPHTIDYKKSIELMEKSVGSYLHLLEQVEQRDEALSGVSLKESEVRYHLNKWFFEQELPPTQKKVVVTTDKDGNAIDTRPMTLNDFRSLTVKDNVELPSQHRYDELMEAFNRELGYNKELKLDLSMYTVYATITNYLSRRVEKSGSKAPQEVKDERASAKLSYFDDVIKELAI